uniref:Putative ml domain protein n=1 Tax=Ixodes ricinus TaxID=34613 RepID=A0A6B0U0U5_IXORI
MNFLLFLGASFTVAAAELRAIAFQSCGGEVTDVRVQPCTREPCSIKRGETAVIEVPFRATEHHCQVEPNRSQGSRLLRYLPREFD